jgi:phosphate transport system permease protein
MFNSSSAGIRCSLRRAIAFMAPTMDLPPEDLDRTRATALAATTTVPVGAAGVIGSRPPRTPRTITDEPSRTDKVFNLVTTSAGAVVLALLGLIGVFLLLRGRKAFDEAGWSFFTRVEWNTTGTHPQIGVLGLLTGTVIVAIIAVTIAIPLGVCAALFITDYAPPRLRSALTSLIDLLAAIPSLLYGIWGFLLLGNQIAPLSEFLARHFGWIPIFRTDNDNVKFVQSMFIAGIVVSLMVLPIIAAITREVFSRTPPGEKEAALALGGTRWGMIRTVVLPFGRGGIIGGSMLGLGRALGETIAVSLLLPQAPLLTARILQAGGSTISGFIALRAGGDEFTASGLMLAGLVLFVLTLATNMIASVVIARSRSGVGVEA